MVDIQLLDKKIEQSGFRIDHIISTLGLSRTGYYKKRNGKSSFRAAEIYVLRDLLKLSPEEEAQIFFADKVGS